jgi:ferritin-like metal-binding protein YciE
MAKVPARRDRLINQLRRLYDAEEQLLRALPPLTSCAKSEQLSTVLADHFEETREHVRRLRRAFGLLNVPARRLPCEAMAALVQSGLAIIDEYGGCGASLLDTALIDAAHQIERYEITAYRRVMAEANAHGCAHIAALLGLTLKEEEVADRLLSMAARATDPSLYGAERLDLL